MAEMVCPKCEGKNWLTTSRGPMCKNCQHILEDIAVKPIKQVQAKG